MLGALGWKIVEVWWDDAMYAPGEIVARVATLL